LLNKAAIVEQYYRFIHADASAGNEGILEGKTYTAFQIIWRLWKAGRKKRILFLADGHIVEDLGASTAHEILETLERVSGR